jgi:hypothetical protein
MASSVKASTSRLVPPVPLNEHRMWIAERDGHTAEARICVFRHAIELRVFVAGHLTFSDRRKHGQDARELGYKSERTRAYFRARGWDVR